MSRKEPNQKPTDEDLKKQDWMKAREEKIGGQNIQGRGRDDRPLEEIIEEGIGIDEAVSLTPEEEEEYDRRHGKGWPRSG